VGTEHCDWAVGLIISSRSVGTGSAWAWGGRGKCGREGEGDGSWTVDGSHTTGPGLQEA
jgi:hypothetical protein